MGKKYRKYKNAVEKYLSSEKGRVFFHRAYAFGASIVVLGALFKINHYDYASEIMFIGLMAEAIIFALSAFDHPTKEYHWEDVYPVLGEERRGGSSDDDDESETAAVSGSSRGVSGGTVIIGGGVSGITSTAAQSTGAGNVGTTTAGKGVPTVIGGGFAGAGSGAPVIPDVADASATEKYSEQLTKLSDSMEKFADVTASLTQVSNTLLDSFKSITDNSDGIGQNTLGYITQMEALNRNISGLNTIYEIQLKGVSGQINTVEQINAGLDRIKKLYDGSLADSSIFKTETEKMAQQLAELNRVYARMLQAMTVNMNMGMGGFGNTGMQEQK